MTLDTLWRRRVFDLEVVVFASVLVADQLFYDAPLGWTVGAYLIGVGLILARRYRLGRLRRIHQLGLTASLAALAAALVVEPGPLALTLAGVGIVSVAMVGRAGPTARPAAWVDRWSRLLRRAWPAPFRHVARRWERRRPPRSAPARAPTGRKRAGWDEIGRSWGLPATGTFVFVALFAAANPMFVHGIERAFSSALDLLEMGVRLLSPVRWTFWFFTAWCMWVLLRIPTRSRDGARTFDVLPDVDWVESWVDGRVLVRSLVLFNAVFACQNLLDVRYLWGGSTLPDGMTYAEYAHRGAYPLILTALMAAAFVLIVFRPGRAPAAAQRTRPLVLVWIAQNVLLTFAAAWRLGLYVEAYGLTRLRVWAGLWMVLVAFGLATIVVRILTRRTNAWLVQVNVVAATLALYACAIVNVDGTIAEFNTRHARAVRGHGASLDVPYLASLGPEALPALEWYARNAPAPTDRATRAAAEAARLRGELETRLADWRGWTVRRARIAATVAPRTTSRAHEAPTAEAPRATGSPRLAREAPRPR